MGFDQLAKNLLATAAPKKPSGKDESGLLEELRAASFARAELLQEYRTLYDNTDNPAVKKAILSDIAKIQNLMTPDEKSKDTPTITINVFGNEARVGTMLCPVSET